MTVSGKKLINVNNRIKWPKISAMFFAAVLILSIITSSLATYPLSALTTSSSKKNDADWQIKSYLYYSAIKSCFNNTGFNDDFDGLLNGDSISPANANIGDWFASANLDIEFGSYMSGSIGTNGKTFFNCNNYGDSSFVKAAMNHWGVTGVEAFCEMGFTRVGFGSDACTNTTGTSSTANLELKDVNNGDTAKVVAAFDKFITKVHGSVPQLADYQKYILYKGTLQKDCIPNIDNSPSLTAVTADNKYGYNDISWVDVATKNIISGSYTGNKKPTELTKFWEGELKKAGFINPGYTCSAVVDGMNKYASAYLSQLKKDSDFNNAQLNDSAEKQAAIKASQSKSSCTIEGIGWILCPVINFMAKIADGAFGFLADSFLRTNVEIFNDNSSGENPTFAAWSTMRNLANVAFVIVFLIIIFSQISSYGISNYGIKKMLPRLVVAAILVNISYFICQIAVDISNIVGFSIKDMLSGLVDDKNIALNAINDTGSTQSGPLTALALTMLGATATGIAFWGAFSLLPAILIAAVVALVMILFILVARQAIIIMLIVLSPLAFVAFLLPNTSGLFDKWKKTFTAMLMLFPIIAVVFGASSLASTILGNTFSSNTEGVEKWMGQLISAAVLVVPLFVVPGLLKKSLEAIPMLGQMASSLSGRANGNIGKKLGEAYKGGDFAKGMESRSQLKEKYRNREYAKRLGTSAMTRTLAGGLSPVMSKLPSAFGGEKARYINRSIEGAVLSSANKAEADDISERQLVLRNQILAGKTTSAQEFKDSVARNDSIGARAAMSIQLESGGGRDKAHGLIKEAAVNETFTSTGGLSKLQGHIASTNPSLSDKDVVLGNWSHAGGDISTIEKDAGTFNVTDTNMAAQSYSNLLLAAASGQMTKEQATRIINTPSLTVGLKPTERMAIENVSKGMPINNNIDENGKIIKTQNNGSSDNRQPQTSTYDKDGNTITEYGVIIPRSDRK